MVLEHRYRVSLYEYTIVFCSEAKGRYVNCPLYYIFGFAKLRIFFLLLNLVYIQVPNDFLCDAPKVNKVCIISTHTQKNANTLATIFATSNKLDL